MSKQHVYAPTLCFVSDVEFAHARQLAHELFDGFDDIAQADKIAAAEVGENLAVLFKCGKNVVACRNLFCVVGIHNSLLFRFSTAKE